MLNRIWNNMNLVVHWQYCQLYPLYPLYQLCQLYQLYQFITFATLNKFTSSHIILHWLLSYHHIYHKPVLNPLSLFNIIYYHCWQTFDIEIYISTKFIKYYFHIWILLYHIINISQRATQCTYWNQYYL